MGSNPISGVLFLRSSEEQLHNLPIIETLKCLEHIRYDTEFEEVETVGSLTALKMRLSSVRFRPSLIHTIDCPHSPQMNLSFDK